MSPDEWQSAFLSDSRIYLLWPTSSQTPTNRKGTEDEDDELENAS